jgi:hypothetical protein
LNLCIGGRCFNRATWAVVLHLRHRERMPSAKLVTSLGVCDRCKPRLKVGDVLAAGVWDAVIREVEQRRLTPYPKRGLTLLRFEPLLVGPRLQIARAN